MSLTEQNIESVLVLCKKGNQLAQLEIYKRYQQAMYNISFRIVKDTADAEDIMQESFLTAFNKLNTLKDLTSFGAWLKRIVVNNSIVAYKNSQRFTVFEEGILNEESYDDTNGIAEENYSETKTAQVLFQINQLHENYQKILTLHFIEGYDYEEICDILQISYANCRTLISRAKESLRKKLAKAS